MRCQNFDTLIVAGGSAPESFTMGNWKYSKVIAADSGYDTAKRLGIIPTDVVGDLDSTKFRDEIIAQGFKPCSHDKDQTDTELALMKKIGEYDLVGGGGGRLDHIFSILSLFLKYGVPRFWFTAADVIMGFNGGGCYIDSPIDTDFSVLPVEEEANVFSDGFVWELGDRPISRSFISQSNRNRRERVFMTASAPILIRVSLSSFKPGMLHIL